ncbi:MAG: winged helix-turn-helix domain-containing protein [Bryobacteraceae bacterium]|nr:winged helix-turn-helix domain-containing protein [Bryobacteraceae bacterium]
MPARAIVAKELAGLLSALAHPHRIRIVEELGRGEMDVNSLQQELGISHSGVSQNLAILRAHRLVAERREGRHVIYRLAQPELALWLLQGLDFLEREISRGESRRDILETARQHWQQGERQKAGVR